jgi:hypothetical protein
MYANARTRGMCALLVCAARVYMLMRACVCPLLPAVVVQILTAVARGRQWNPCCKQHLRTHSSKSARASPLISTSCSCRRAYHAAQDRQSVPSRVNRWCEHDLNTVRAGYEFPREGVVFEDPVIEQAATNQLYRQAKLSPRFVGISVIIHALYIPVTQVPGLHSIRWRHCLRQ